MHQLHFGASSALALAGGFHAKIFTRSFVRPSATAVATLADICISSLAAAFVFSASPRNPTTFPYNEQMRFEKSDFTMNI
jgi:hypothetical protein